MSFDPRALFTPFRIGSLSLPNRVVMAPMTRCKSPGYIPNETNAEYYKKRARGGVGLIITEGTWIGHAAANGYPDVPAFEGPKSLAGWRAVAEAVHAEGAAIMPQLWHVGSVRQRGMGPDPSLGGVAPSAVMHPTVEKNSGEGGGELPRALTDADISELLEAYATAAENAHVLGFDGVEIHGAHGYLIDQFFWGHTNRRTDRFGGDAVARTRFATEVVKAVRGRVPNDFPVGLRLSQFKLDAYDARLFESPDQLERWLAPLTDAGVDLFHCSQRRIDTPEFEGSPLNLAGWTKKLSGRPTVSVGSVGLSDDFISTFSGEESSQAGLQRVVERLEAEEFDLVAVGRALLADPAWANKVRDGVMDDITPFRREHLEQYP